MTEAEKRIKAYEDMCLRDRSAEDNQIAQVGALCEIARALNRLGDLYLTDLIFQNRIPPDHPEQLEPESADYRSPAAKAEKTFLRRVYSDARSK